MERDQVVNTVTDTIIDAVRLHHLDRNQITSETVLTQGGLNLDSIDILEVVVAIEHKFGVKIASPEVGKKYFQSIGSIADFLMTQTSASQ